MVYVSVLRDGNSVHVVIFHKTIKEDKSLAKVGEKHMTSIGGQAVIEGVMMRGPSYSAIAVRKPDGEIEIDTKANSSLVARWKLTKIPIIRGVISFFDSMIIGVKATMYSAEFMDLEDDDPNAQPSKFDAWLERTFGDKLMSVLMWISVILALALGIGLFILLPTIVAGFVRDLFTNATWIQFPQQFADACYGVVTNRVFLNVLESVVKLALFLLYMVLVSRLKDMQRVFEYHGAEHKTIACYEDGGELTPENAKRYTRFHPRCGTSFLLIVMVISVFFFSFLTWGNVWMRMGTRLLLLPVVAGVSYEIIKFAGRSKNRCVAWLTKPGLWLQRLTTREPDESQLEVAIASLKSVLPKDGEDDTW